MLQATMSRPAISISALSISKVLVFVAALVPVSMLIWRAVEGTLGAEPVETILHGTGDWALRFLLLTLTVSPLRQLTGKSFFLKFRRMLGLFCFFYAALHLSTYLVFEHFFDWQEILKDVVKRPYITIGFAAFLMLLPLTFTSSNKMMKRLGKNWKTLHRMVYVIAVFAIFHFLWLIKADFQQPLVYGVITVLLLFFRSVWFQAIRKAWQAH